MKRLITAFAVTIALASSAMAQKTTIEVQYPLAFIFDKVFQELKTEFEKRIRILRSHIDPPTRNTRMRRRPRCATPSPSSFPTSRFRPSTCSGRSSTAASPWT